MNRRLLRTGIALALQLAALALLGLGLLGASWLDPRGQPRVLLLVDRSQSVPRAAADRAVAEVAQAAQAAGRGTWQRIDFAGRPALPSTRASDAATALEPTATNIEAALQAALALHAQSPLDRIVVVSDGLETAGDAARGLRAVRESGLPLHWIAVGRPPPETRLAEVLVPDRAQVGQRLRVEVRLQGRLDRPLRVKASARGGGGESQQASAIADGSGRATLEFDAVQPGALLVDLALEDPADGQAVDAMPDAAVIDIAPRAAILYAQGSGGALARSLQRGGWTLQRVPAARLDAFADGLASYQAVVLDDVAVSDAGPRFWNVLVAAVRDRGLGLLVLGGERSFARGGYRQSTLESVLPLTSEPAALDQPLAIVFAVDKSGSMGQGSGGVDRFQLAQQAVIETARGLTDRDSLGLLVFDVEPRWLIPVGPASGAMPSLQRDWQTSPHGGTRIAPALEAAMAELEHVPAARRMLVVVTDGFAGDAPLVELSARLARSHIEIVALAVGLDADTRALERLIGPEAGLVWRVGEAAELPGAMRSGVERRRARVERGPMAVAQTQALPFAPGTFENWPPVAAHAVTRSRPEARVAVQTRRSEPLIASQRAGHGLVVAVSCGLGAWTPQWLSWPQWPRLAGGLVGAVAGAGAPLSLAVIDQPQGLQVEADLPRQVGLEGLGIAVSTPTTPGRAIRADLVAPGRLRATLPESGPGLYTFLVSGAQGTQRFLHLRRSRAETGSWGINPKLQAWRAQGLISEGMPDFNARSRRVDRDDAGPDRSLVGLALALFLSAVLVDRARVGARAWLAMRRRWRPRRD